jgi:hypothetical protein
MKNGERVLTRLERAGGALSEAVQLIESQDPALANLIVSVNVSLGDLRRALVRLEGGQDPDDVHRDLQRQLRENVE